jgi:uncharacterized protein (TIGR03435 family)
MRVMGRLRLAVVLLVAALTAAVAGGAAQSTSVNDLSFEVASIKPHVTGASYQLQVLPGGRLRSINGTVERLISYAYELRPDRFVGAPEWLSEFAVDINAKAADRTDAYSRAEVRGMMRTLLRNRFALRTHLESRDTAVYLLVTKRTDRTLGPPLQPSTLDCEKYYADLPRARSEGRPPAEGPHCELRIEIRGGAMRFSAGGKTMSEIAEFLTGHVDRPVIDGTGLAGVFDFNLAFTPDHSAPWPGAQNDDRQSLATALDQAGLKLESRRAPMQMLVIDSVERPSAD